MACVPNCSCELCAVLGMGGPPVRGEFLPDTSRVLGGRNAAPSVGGDRGMVLGIGTSAWRGGLWDDLGGALWPAADAQGPMAPPFGGGALGLGGFGPAWERCSEEDQFVASSIIGANADGSRHVVTLATFQGFWPGMVVPTTAYVDAPAIADTTVQRTTLPAYGRSTPFGAVTTYPPGSLRMYLSAKTNGLADEYTLLSTNGLVFELEVDHVEHPFPMAEHRAALPLGTGVGQGESYVDHTGTVWMYYNGGDGIYVKTSPNGFDFGAPQFTGLDAATTGWSGLTGLSVVKIGPNSYRGYFGNELDQPVSPQTHDGMGSIFAADSTDLQHWTPVTPSDGLNVGAHGEVIGYRAGGRLNWTGARQPFALKRNDPANPNCVTLFYYRPPAAGVGTRIYYSTALDGMTFNTEWALNLDDLDALDGVRTLGGVAGPTLINVSGLPGWVEGADPPVYLLYVDGGDQVSGLYTEGHFIQAYTLRKVV